MSAAPIWLFPLDSLSITRGNDRKAIEAHLDSIGVKRGEAGIAYIAHKRGCAIKRGADCDCDVRVMSGPPIGNRAARRRAARKRGR